MEDTIMTKRDYLQPTIEVVEINTNVQILAGSIKTTGLDGDDLTEDSTPGHIDGAMSPLFETDPLNILQGI